MVQFRLPAGATFGRTREVERKAEQYFLQGPEKKNIHTFFAVTGGGGGGASGQNTGQAFINLAPFGERKGANNSAEAIVDRASGAFRGLRDAQVFALVPGAIRGLGQSAGFTMELQNSSGLSREQFAAARDRLLAAAASDSQLAQVRLSELPDVASLKVNIDVRRAHGARAHHDRRQFDALNRLGGPLRQRFHRPRPGEARLCPRRCALSLGAGRHRRLVRSQ